jgi:regulator of protease activity HflC (stomatin/prohibitin superfamily)
MPIYYIVLLVVVFVIIPGLRVVQQYQKGVVFLLGKITGIKEPGLTWIIPYFSWMRKVDFRTVTLPIPPQKIITKDNVSIDVAAVAYYRVKNATKSLIAIQNVDSAINQIAQTTVRNIVGQFMLDQVLSETVKINERIKEIIDVHTEAWGVEIQAVEMKNVEIPASMQRAMAQEAEALREKRARIIKAEAEFEAALKLREAADEIMKTPASLELRRMQMLTEIGAEQNTMTVVMMPSEFVEAARALAGKKS